MKFYYKILNILSAVLIFIPSAFAIEESLEDIVKEINKVRQEITQLQSSNVKEAIIIDKALQELDQVMEFVGKSVENGDIKGAINTINFIERSISDVASIIPKEFKSEKVKENLKELSEKDMNEIMKITQGATKNKNKKTKKLFDSMLVSKMKGMDTFKISENLTDLGIKTIDKKEIKKVLTASIVNSGHEDYLRARKGFLDEWASWKAETKGISKEEALRQIRNEPMFSQGVNSGHEDYLRARSLFEDEWASWEAETKGISKEEALKQVRNEPMFSQGVNSGHKDYLRARSLFEDEWASWEAETKGISKEEALKQVRSEPMFSQGVSSGHEDYLRARSLFEDEWAGQIAKTKGISKEEALKQVRNEPMFSQGVNSGHKDYLRARSLFEDEWASWEAETKGISKEEALRQIRNEPMFSQVVAEASSSAKAAAGVSQVAAKEAAEIAHAEAKARLENETMFSDDGSQAHQDYLKARKGFLDEWASWEAEKKDVKAAATQASSQAAQAAKSAASGVAQVAAKEAAETAKDAAKEAAETAKDAAKEAAETAKDAAKEAAETAHAEAKSSLENEPMFSDDGSQAHQDYLEMRKGFLEEWASWESE